MMNKVSVKVELAGVDDEDVPSLVQEAFEEALDLASIAYDDQIFDKFFTMRFDETLDGGVAATISIAEKRD